MRDSPQVDFDDIMEDVCAAGNPSLLQSLELTKRALGWSTKKAALEMLKAFESGELELATGSQGKAMDMLRRVIDMEGIE
jgi:hypothetical protein